MKKQIVFAALALGIAPQAFGDGEPSPHTFGNPWSEAEALFARRAEGQGTIGEARARYVDLLANAQSPAEKILAVSQLGRLAIYEGEIVLPKSDAEGRRKIFSECFCADPKVDYNPSPAPRCDAPGFVDAISPAKIGEAHPAYTYFRSVCTAYFGEVAGPMEKLAYVSWLKEDFANGQALDTRFEGGGILRVAAGVYVNPAAAAVQLYNPDQALEMATRAVASAAYPGDPSNGQQYFENQAIMADALQQLASDRPSAGYREKALGLVVKTLEEMDERFELDDLPAGRAPEFKHYYSRIKASYKELTGRTWPQK